MICECTPESLSVATTVMTSDPRATSSARLAMYPPSGIVKTGWLSLTSDTLIVTETWWVDGCMNALVGVAVGVAYRGRETWGSLVRGGHNEREDGVALSVQVRREKENSSLIIDGKHRLCAGVEGGKGLKSSSLLVLVPSAEGCWTSMEYTTTALLPASSSVARILMMGEFGWRASDTEVE